MLKGPQAYKEVEEWVNAGSNQPYHADSGSEFCVLWQIFPQLCSILNSSMVRSLASFSVAART